ncbi:MAG: hypothetical protein ACKVZJ_07865 [Phycisphaerales bacterium]
MPSKALNLQAGTGHMGRSEVVSRALLFPASPNLNIAASHSKARTSRRAESPRGSFCVSGAAENMENGKRHLVELLQFPAPIKAFPWFLRDTGRGVGTALDLLRAHDGSIRESVRTHLRNPPHDRAPLHLPPILVAELGAKVREQIGFTAEEFASMLGAISDGVSKETTCVPETSNPLRSELDRGYRSVRHETLSACEVSAVRHKPYFVSTSADPLLEFGRLFEKSVVPDVSRFDGQFLGKLLDAGQNLPIRCEVQQLLNQLVVRCARLPDSQAEQLVLEAVTETQRVLRDAMLESINRRRNQFESLSSYLVLVLRDEVMSRLNRRLCWRPNLAA